MSKSKPYKLPELPIGQAWVITRYLPLGRNTQIVDARNYGLDVFVIQANFTNTGN